MEHLEIKDGSRLFLIFPLEKLLGFVLDSTTVSSNPRSKICTDNPKSFVGWYG